MARARDEVLPHDVQQLIELVALRRELVLNALHPNLERGQPVFLLHPHYPHFPASNWSAPVVLAHRPCAEVIAVSATLDMRVRQDKGLNRPHSANRHL